MMHINIGSTQMVRISRQLVKAKANVSKVSQLTGRPKLSSLDGTHTVVPLLLPSEHDLPFSVCLDLSRPHALTHPDSLPSTSRPTRDETSEGFLDILYVLSGEGELVGSDGSKSKVTAGDSVIAWAQSTCIHSISETVVASLRFSIPLELVPQQAATADAAIASTRFQSVDDSEGGSMNMTALIKKRMMRDVETIAILPSIRSESEGSAGSFLTLEESSLIMSSIQTRASSAMELLDLSPAKNEEAELKRLWLDDKAGPRHHLLQGTDQCVVLQRAMEEFVAYRFPRQSNKLAFVFDPLELSLPLSFGIEVFEPGHVTPIHIHTAAHELFFVLAGSGEAVCDGHRFNVSAGQVLVFPPGSKHGLDNLTSEKLYCLQLMAPNENFVEHVKMGENIGALDREDICNLTLRC
jgi:quercetin dioxygenase-like cupin family protein